MSIFSTCIITTSNEQRAGVYRELIERRKNHGIYPSEIEFRVYSDPENVHAGSGGATLLAIYKYLNEIDPYNQDTEKLKSKKILIINSGGPDNSLTLYKPEGMPFTPVPVDSSSIYSPVLLDLQLNFFLKYPWHQGEIVIAPGDVFIDCSQLPLLESHGDIHGFAISSTFDRGTHHGVFTFDSYMRSVTGYYQKPALSFLKAQATIEGTDQCAVDTGILSFSFSFVNKLIEFGKVQFNGKNLINNITEGLLSFNLYLELITASIRGITREMYIEKIATSTRANTEFLDCAFNLFNSCTLTATLIRNAMFHHPDTMRSYVSMCIDLQIRPVDLWYAQSFSELTVKRNSSWIVYNTSSTRTPLRKGNPVLVESVRNATFENPMGNNIFSGLDQWDTEVTIPDSICIDKRIVDNKNIILVYGIDDTFDRNMPVDKLTFCGIPLQKWLDQHSLTLKDLGITENGCSLSDAHLFCTGVSEEFICGYWNPPSGKQWADTFRSSSRYSLKSASSCSLALDRDDIRKKIRTSLLNKQISSGYGWISISSKDIAVTFAPDQSKAKLETICRETSDLLVKAYRSRLLDTIDPQKRSSTSVGFLENTPPVDFSYSKFTTDFDRNVIVKCPVRVDIAGGWTDLPPFTLRHGGAVVNMALNCNGIEPVQVFCKRIKEPQIRINSINSGVSHIIGEYKDFSSIPQECELAGAVLKGTGFSKSQFSSLSSHLNEIGGGIDITTFCGVPKGSGLGTSSILLAAIIRGVGLLFGKDLLGNNLLKSVIAIEQLIGATSGWQDCLGGLNGGIKLLQSKAGMIPEIAVQYLHNGLFTRDNLSLFTLVNTGIPRSSQYPARSIAALMYENIPSCTFTLNYLKSLALEAAIAVSANDFTLLARVMNESRTANNRLHISLANQKLESLFDYLKADYMAVKTIGAGNGGFTLFLSESQNAAANLRKAISGLNGPAIVDFTMNHSGLSSHIL